MADLRGNQPRIMRYGIRPPNALFGLPLLVLAGVVFCYCATHNVKFHMPRVLEQLLQAVDSKKGDNTSAGLFYTLAVVAFGAAVLIGGRFAIQRLMGMQIVIEGDILILSGQTLRRSDIACVTCTMARPGEIRLDTTKAVFKVNTRWLSEDDTKYLRAWLNARAGTSDA
jgi:hypothetical protein